MRTQLAFRRASALGAVVAVLMAALVATAPAQAATTFSTTTAWSWVYQGLAAPGTVDQTATARITGLSDKDKNGAFQLRRASSTTFVRVTFSGTRYQIAGVVDGTTTSYVDIGFVPGTDGTARVDISGTTIKAYWNGVNVETHTIAALASFTGTYVGLGIWQNVGSAVTMSNAIGSPLSSSGTAPAPTTTTPSGSWLSGASGDGASSGAFGTWRGAPLQISAAWNDSYAEQTAQYAVQPGAPYGTWNKDLDLAIGGIFKNYGQSWAAAASGAYDSRWTTAFQNIKKGWGSRTGTLHIRFAHEFNGDWVPWSVTGSEAASFVTTWRRVYGIMKSILPNAKMVFSPNDGSARSLNLDWRSAWPGAAYVDEISVDSYNQYPYVDTYSGFLTKINMTDYYGAPVGIEKHRLFAASVGKPFALSEWGSNASMGDGAAFIGFFHDWVAAHAGSGAGQVTYEIYFNVSTSFNGVFQLYPTTRQPNAAAAYVRYF